MKIVIIGAGEVGKGLAKQLVEENHHVTIVERQAATISNLEAELDVLCIEGNGASMQVLEDAGIKTADMLVAVSDQDEMNMLACSVAHACGVATTIARVRSEEYTVRHLSLYAEAMHINLLINPDEAAAQEFYDLLQIPIATEVADFAEGRMKLVGFRVTPKSPVANHQIKELPGLGYGESILVASVVRHNELIIPKGDTRVVPGDRLFVLTREEALDNVSRMGGRDPHPPNRVVIVGGSGSAYYLATRLAENHIQCTLIEMNQRRCERLAEELEDTLVLCADGTDVSSLVEAGVAGADAFIAASEDDETNILSALLAKEQGAQKVISLLRKPQYLPLMEHIRLIDVALNPRIATINAILRFVRQGKILSIATIYGDRAEAMEVVVSADSPLIGRPLRENFLPQDVLLGGIVRDGEIRIPRGDDSLLAGDSAIIVAPRRMIKEINELLAKSKLTSRIRRFLTGESAPIES
ncbi:MAG: Trk system potassium transporter TrkA [bacterium]